MSGWLNVLAARAAAVGHQAQVLHPPVDGRRPQPQGHLRPQARHQGRRRVQADQDGRPRHRDQRTLPAVRQADEPGRHPPRHDHRRRRPWPGQAIYMHTGYKEGVGGLVYPSIGSIVSAELGRDDFAAAELRDHRRPQLRRRLPRAEAPAARSSSDPDTRRREPQAARRPGRVRRPRRPAGRDGAGLPPRLQGRVRHGPRDDLPPGRHADEVEGGQGVRPVRRSRPGQGGLRRQQVRRRLPAGPPAGRGGRLVRRGDAGRLGHAPEQLRPRQEAVAAGRSGHVGPGHGPEGARPARQTRW